MAPNGVDVYFSETTTSGGVRHARIQPSGLLGPLDFAAANPHTADVVVSPNDQFAYAANDDGTVSRYTVGANGALSATGTTTVGSGLSSLAVAPNGQSLFVGSGGDGRIYSFHINGDGTLTAPAAASIAGGTADMAIAPGGGFLYSTGGSSVYQFQINGDSSLTALSPASVSSGGTAAQGIEVTPDGLSAYAVNGTGGGVAQYDIAAGGTLTSKTPATVVPDSSAQSEPYGAAIEPAQGGSAIVYTGHSTLVNGPLPVTPAGAGTGTTTGTGVTGGPGPIAQESLLSGAAAQLLAAQGLVPVAGKTLIAAPVAGSVLVKLPGSNKFVPLETVTSIPVGTIIDARKGQVGLIAAIDAAGHTQSSVFYGGVFRVTQPVTTAAAARKRIVDLRLVGSLGTCKASSKKSASEARRRRHRHLWGNGRGSFRTRGRYASATVRGTKWLMTDTCSTTTTVVARGTVTVFDSVRDLTVRVKAGHRYTARRGTRK